jgi:cytochrome c-type biogenesis protein
MEGDLTPWVAFVAGIISFLSPCVFPIIPGFLAYLAGTSIRESKQVRLEIFINSVFFVLGFSVVFALLGVLLNTILTAFAYETELWLARIGGIIIIFFGLYLTGLIKIPFLEQEHKLEVKRKFKSKYLTSFLFGFAFAVGWSPCVGVILGAILGLAATSPGSAFFLLLMYAFGLGIPFLIVGLFTAQAAKALHRYARTFLVLRVIFGIFLIILGILAFTQKLSAIANLEFLINFFMS